MDRLVITSMIKKKIKESDMNTSSGAVEAISKLVHEIVEIGVDNAKGDKRKTVMDRDVQDITLEYSR